MVLSNLIIIDFVLQHINYRSLLNAKSYLYRYIKYN